ncbi:MAG TPA: ChaB family protein [Oculatellaceae cyanobacterium]|jgi:cation transport regulator
MQYRSTQDLPSHLREHLPEFAQEIYRVTYNNAYRDYADPAKHKDFSSLEEVAHHIAWAAVKKEIEKSSKKQRHLSLG